MYNAVAIVTSAQRIALTMLKRNKNSFSKMFETVFAESPGTINDFGTYTIPKTPSGI
jgi:hypothetical protein